MNKAKLLKRISDHGGVFTESIPGYPLIEISSNDRLLVENHCGILSYSDNCLKIQMPYGLAIIQGISLVMTQLSKEQLVIRGKIQQVYLDSIEECP